MCPVSEGESKFFKGENNVVYTLRAPFHMVLKDHVLLFGGFMLLYK